MPPKRDPPIVILPPHPVKDHPATLIFLHGYHFTASQFSVHPPNDLSIGHHLHKSPLLRHIKIIIPEALPCIHPGMKKNVWYNLGVPIPAPGNKARADEEVEYGSTPGRNEDDMNVSMDYFSELIDSEIQSGTPVERIVLMGDSQGATIAVQYLLTRRLGADLGAVISYGGFPATPMESIYRIQRENRLEEPWSKETQLFILHGKNDPFVPVEISLAWRARLEAFKDRGNGIKSIEYSLVEGMRHALTATLWPHIILILAKVVPLPVQRSVFKI